MSHYVSTQHLKYYSLTCTKACTLINHGDLQGGDGTRGHEEESRHHDEDDKNGMKRTRHNSHPTTADEKVMMMQ